MTTAMVLCAGFGTRLRPLTDELAKPLMPVGDRPMLFHVLEALERGGVTRVVLNTHHRPDDFDSHMGSWEPKVHVIHEPVIFGTAGGVAHAAAALGDDGEVVVWNGDILAPDLDVQALTQRWRETAADLMWVVAPRPIGEGTVGLGIDGSVVRLRGERFGGEASGGDFAGVQVIGAGPRRTFPRKGCLVADVALPLLRRGGRIASFRFDGSWEDVGSPGSLLAANLRWLARKGIAVWVAPDAHVQEGVDLTRTIVGAGARVRGAGLVRESVVFPGAELVAPSDRALVASRSRIDAPPAGDPT